MGPKSGGELMRFELGWMPYGARFWLPEYLLYIEACSRDISTRLEFNLEI